MESMTYEISKIRLSRETSLLTYIQKKYKKIPSIVANEIAKQTVLKCEELNAPFVVIVALMEVESSFNPSSASKKGARGLLQVMYDYWGNRLEIPNRHDLHEIDIGIEAGIKIFMKLYEENKSITKVLEKYLGKNDKDYKIKIFEAMSNFMLHISEQI